MSAGWYGFGKNSPRSGMSSLRIVERPDVRMSSMGGQRPRIARANFSPSIDPGISMSVKTIRMSVLCSKILTASSALLASIASKPASSTSWTASMSKIGSSSTTSTAPLTEALYKPVYPPPAAIAKMHVAIRCCPIFGNLNGSHSLGGRHPFAAFRSRCQPLALVQPHPFPHEGVALLQRGFAQSRGPRTPRPSDEELQT